MLRPHVTTEDLYRVHAGLPWSQFPDVTDRGAEKPYLKGTGTIPTTTLPIQFTRTAGDAISTWNGSFTSTMLEPTVLMNIPERGFFALSVGLAEMVVIDWLPSMTPLINTQNDLEYDYKTVEAGTGLRYSIGGYEDKIMLAYIDVVMELRKRKTYPSAISNNDRIFNSCIIYRALELIYKEAAVTPEDMNMSLARLYKRDYEKELQTAMPEMSGINTVAPVTWGRSS